MESKDAPAGILFQNSQLLQSLEGLTGNGSRSNMILVGSTSASKAATVALSQTADTDSRAEVDVTSNGGCGGH